MLSKTKQQSIPEGPPYNNNQPLISLTRRPAASTTSVHFIHQVTWMLLEGSSQFFVCISILRFRIFYKLDFLLPIINLSKTEWVWIKQNRRCLKYHWYSLLHLTCPPGHDDDDSISLPFAVQLSDWWRRCWWFRVVTKTEKDTRLSISV